MNARLPLSVQHLVPAPLGPLFTLLLLTTVALGQFDASHDRALFPYAIVLLLPPVVRSVLSLFIGRPVVTGALDQKLLGADLLLLTVALLQSNQGTRSPVVIAVYAAACYLGLRFGARRVTPAIALAAAALVISAMRGAVAGGVLGNTTVLLGLIGFGLIPSEALRRFRIEARVARDTLAAIESAARDLGEDSDRRHPAVRKSAYSPEEVEAELQAMGQRVQRWLETVCETLANGTGAARCLVYRPAAAGADLHLVAHSTDPGAVAEAVLAREGVFGVVLKTGQSLMMGTVKQPYGGLVYAGEGDRIGSLLVVPLLRGEAVWGVLVLDAPVAESLGTRDRALVEGVVPLLLSLVDQLADLTTYRRWLSEDKVLHDTSQELAAQAALGALAEILVERTMRLVDARGGALALMRGDISPHVLYASGFDRDPSGLRFPFDKATSLIAQAIRYAQPIRQAGMGRERRPTLLFGTEYGATTEFTDVLVMPLLKPAAHGEERSCIGAIALCRRGDRPFADNDRDRVEMLANQAAAHILNIQLLEESRTQAATDGLTGLPNRRSFADKLDEMLQRSARFETPVSLLMMDVDHFKKVNDTYGHPLGDEVLRKLAEILRRSVRDAVDMAARYGGEEFVVLLENTPLEGAVQLGERLREALAAETFIHLEGSQTTPFQVTMSIGVATTQDGGEAEAIVERADQALYRAKEFGRNRVLTG